MMLQANLAEKSYAEPKERDSYSSAELLWITNLLGFYNVFETEVEEQRTKKERENERE